MRDYRYQNNSWQTVIKFMVPIWIIILLCLFILPGCDLLTNIYGWDLSACSGNMDVCGELFFDNNDKLLHGWEGALE